MRGSSHGSHRSLARVVREARADLGTREGRGVDWKMVDESLFERLDREDASEERSMRRAEAAAARPWTRGAWLLAGMGMAAAVAGAMVVGGSRAGGLLEASGPDAAEYAQREVMTLGSGNALVGGRPVAIGAALRVGDAIEARGPVRAEAPGKAWLQLEAGSLATVTAGSGASPGSHGNNGTIVLALERGAVEADVTPVAQGEAFAVDVDGVRIAVHGTHLRVARAGERVTIDLSEGVVSVGAPPRSGSTLGPLVTAPAHVELAANDLDGTLSVSHEPADVRAPVSLRPASALRSVAPLSPSVSVRVEVPAAHTGAAAGSVALREPRSVPPASGEPSSPPALAPALPPVDPHPEASLAAAVRACVPAAAGAANLTLVMTTTLRLELDDSGMVHSARFDPPVAADVNACTAPVIYKTHFGHGGGSVVVPIDVTVPSSAP